MDHLDAWLAFGTAFLTLLATALGLYFDQKKTAGRARKIELARALAPKVVLAVERFAAATPTKKDDEALRRVKEAMAAAGEHLPEEMVGFVRELLAGEYQAYKVDALGIPAHEDGAAGKAASLPPPAPAA